MKIEAIDKMKLERRLRLTPREKISHYAILISPIILAAPILEDLWDGLINSKANSLNFSSNEIIFGIICVALLFIFYFMQRRRLNFHELKVKFTDAEFEEALNRTVKEMEWHIQKNEDNVVIALRFDGIGIWGEKITILKEQSRILINSICDPNRKASITSNGWNRRNINSFILNLRDTLMYLPPDTSDRLAPNINKWTLGKILYRILMYPICILLIIMGGFLVLNSENIKDGLVSFFLIILGLAFFYFDLKIVKSIMKEERMKHEHITLAKKKEGLL